MKTLVAMAVTEIGSIHSRDHWSMLTEPMPQAKGMSIQSVGTRMGFDIKELELDCLELLRYRDGCEKRVAYRGK